MTEVLVRPSGSGWAVLLDGGLVTLRDTKQDAVNFGNAVASSHLPSTLTIRHLDGSIAVTSFAQDHFPDRAVRRAWKQIVDWLRGA